MYVTVKQNDFTKLKMEVSHSAEKDPKMRSGDFEKRSGKFVNPKHGLEPILGDPKQINTSQLMDHATHNTNRFYPMKLQSHLYNSSILRSSSCLQALSVEIINIPINIIHKYSI